MQPVHRRSLPTPRAEAPAGADTAVLNLAEATYRAPTLRVAPALAGFRPTVPSSAEAASSFSPHTTSTSTLV